ncbi:hypothetical protein L208DRAFT_1382572 [Tricholoma matsutake]|nr:hypothetical protein L208DRAFT_1382572 [Tricholoma matsutake 945]
MSALHVAVQNMFICQAHQASIQVAKENVAPQVSHRGPLGCQRQPTEKVATLRAEEVAAMERREAAKAQKLQHAHQAIENSDDEGDGTDRSQSDDVDAPTTFTTQTIASKSVILKNKALAKHDCQLAAHAEAARKAEDLAECDRQCAVQAHTAHEAKYLAECDRQRAVQAHAARKAKYLAKRDHQLVAHAQAARKAEDTSDESVR